MKKKIIWGIVIIVAIVVVWNNRMSSRSSSREGSPVAERSGGQGELEQKIMSFTIDGRSSKGVKQWRLEGDSAEIIEDEIHLKDLKAVAYGEGTTVDLVSDRGIYCKDKGEVELIGNVRVVTSEGTVLKTNSAKWSQVTKTIFSEEFVRIEREGMIAEGKGASANSEEKKAALEKDVTVVMEPDTRVKCNGPLEVIYGENMAIFHDNVNVEDKDGKLYADKLTVYFDPETQKLAKVVAEGNVKIRRGDSYTISEKAIYTDGTKSAQLIGNPRVVIAPEEFDEIQNIGGGAEETGDEGSDS